LHEESIALFGEADLLLAGGLNRCERLQRLLFNGRGCRRTQLDALIDLAASEADLGGAQRAPKVEVGQFKKTRGPS